NVFIFRKYSKHLNYFRFNTQTFIDCNVFPECRQFVAKIDQKILCITTKTCTQIQNFKCNSLENYNDSEFTVKTKNAPFFMNFPNMYKIGNFFPDRTGHLNNRTPTKRNPKIHLKDLSPHVGS